jgi:hypothetical protein
MAIAKVSIALPSSSSLLHFYHHCFWLQVSFFQVLSLFVVIFCLGFFCYITKLFVVKC